MLHGFIHMEQKSRLLRLKRKYLLRLRMYGLLQKKSIEETLRLLN